MDTFDDFRKQVLYHKKGLEQAQDTVCYAQKIISKEKEIGLGQCSRIVKSMESVEEPLRECYELLADFEKLPLTIKSHRHRLLLILGYTTQLVQKLIPDIHSLHETYKTASQYEARAHREYILKQLDDLLQNKQEIETNIEILLLTANSHRQ